jgi:uncharacterized protein
MEDYHDPIHRRFYLISKTLIVLGVVVLFPFVLSPIVSTALLAAGLGIPYRDVILTIKDMDYHENGRMIFLWANGLTQLLGFGLGSYIIIRSLSKHPYQFIGMDRNLRPTFVLISFVMVVSFAVILPFIHEINHWILPYIKRIFPFLHEQGEHSLLTLKKIIHTTDKVHLLQNLFFIAFVPALFEELFFRGALQRFLRELTGSSVVSIILGGGIFALLHFRLGHFLPIWAMGILFGYVYQQTGHIVYPIIMHFINNGSIVILNFYLHPSEHAPLLSEDYVPPIGYVLIALLTFLTVVLWFHKKTRLYQELSPGHGLLKNVNKKEGVHIKPLETNHESSTVQQQKYENE